MKLFKNLKKGFTLIELVVVIAVIAILSAVSVVSYVAITNKAKNSNDETVLRQVNMAIAMRKTETEPATMSDALLALKEEGGISDVEKLLTATYSKNSFAYDQDNKEFVLIKEGEEPEKAQRRRYFKMVSNSDELKKANDDGYSCYLKKEYSGSVITSLQLDVGENLNISSISYTSSSSERAVIRTNGGVFTVGAPNGTIYHYGMAQQVDISSVAPNDCYHEYGIVKGQLNITKGKVVLESKANVGFVNVTATSASDINVEIKSGSDYGRLTCKDETILNAVAAAAKVPAEKTMKTVEGTVAIVNNVAYTDITSAINTFETTKNSTFELFVDIKNAVSSGSQLPIKMPEGASLDGHGYSLEGNVALYINQKGGTVKNLIFHMTENKSTRSQSQIERYGEANAGTLSSLYGNSLQGKAVIEGCTFDTAEWDAIQITPTAGSEVVIKNNIFKHTTESFKQNRYIHIESNKATKNTDFSATISNNDFYDCDYLTNQAVEVYWPTSANKVTISHNYMEDYATAVQQDHAACIGFPGSSYISSLSGYNMSSEPNNK